MNTTTFKSLVNHIFNKNNIADKNYQIEYVPTQVSVNEDDFTGDFYEEMLDAEWTIIIDEKLYNNKKFMRDLDHLTNKIWKKTHEIVYIEIND